MSAILSDDGLYRFRLEREVAPGGIGLTFAYFGINPSTADATLDDATVRKWRGFTLRNGGRRFLVGNVFAFRATNPAEVGFSNDTATYLNDRPVPGCYHENLIHLLTIIHEADVLVPCWGRTGKITPQLRYCIGQVLELLHASGKPVLHFGMTKCGSPGHPLMLGYDTRLRPLVEGSVI